VAAGPAALHDAISEQFGVAEDLPCADSSFLAPLKRSPEFRGLRPQLAGKPPHPVYDSWLDDGFHFFVFQLAPDPTPAGTAAAGGLAVFAMHPDQREPVSAVTVVPTGGGSHAQITDVRDPHNTYTAPLPRSGATGDETPVDASPSKPTTND
jgi:hypothetical protein